LSTGESRAGPSGSRGGGRGVELRIHQSLSLCGVSIRITCMLRDQQVSTPRLEAMNSMSVALEVAFDRVEVEQRHWVDLTAACHARRFRSTRRHITSEPLSVGGDVSMYHRCIIEC